MSKLNLFVVSAFLATACLSPEEVSNTTAPGACTPTVNTTADGVTIKEVLGMWIIVAAKNRHENPLILGIRDLTVHTPAIDASVYSGETKVLSDYFHLSDAFRPDVGQYSGFHFTMQVYSNQKGFDCTQMYGQDVGIFLIGAGSTNALVMPDLDLIDPESAVLVETTLRMSFGSCLLVVPEKPYSASPRMSLKDFFAQ